MGDRTAVLSPPRTASDNVSLLPGAAMPVIPPSREDQAEGVQTRAAEPLGISERVLRYKLKKYGFTG